MNAAVTSSEFLTRYSPATQYKRHGIFFFFFSLNVLQKFQLIPQVDVNLSEISIIAIGHFFFFFPQDHTWIGWQLPLADMSPPTRVYQHYKKPYIMHGAFVTSRQFLNNAVVFKSHQDHPQSRGFTKVVQWQHFALHHPSSKCH